MGWLRRRRDLGLRPLSELHDEFAARPGAQSKLDDAEAELTKREHAPHAQHGSELPASTQTPQLGTRSTTCS